MGRVKSFAARVNSWCRGRVVGELRHTEGVPFAVGSVIHFLPVGCWNVVERETFVFRVHEHQWNGFGWRFVRVLELTGEELVEFVSTHMVLERK